MMEQLTLRLSEKEEGLEQAQEEHKQLQNQITSIEQELSSTQDEVNTYPQSLSNLQCFQGIMHTGSLLYCVCDVKCISCYDLLCNLNYTCISLILHFLINNKYSIMHEHVKVICCVVIVEGSYGGS